MEIILVSDIHLGISNSDHLWLKTSYKLFQNICEYANDKHIKNLCILGDIFHDRRKLNPLCICIAEEIKQLLSKYFDKIYLIIGNHDIYYRTSRLVTPLIIFSDNPKFEIINPYKYFLEDSIIMASWGVNKTDLLKHKAKIMLGHFEISDIMQSSFTPTSDIVYDSCFFDEAGIVFSGHYHKPCVKGNIVYTGSPFQMNFGDPEMPRGYYILDTNNPTNYTLVKFDDSPKYRLINYGQRVNESYIRNNVIRVNFHEDVGSLKAMEYIDKITLMKPYKIDVKYMYNFQLKNEDTKSTESDILIIKRPQEIIQSYIETVDLPKHISRKMLSMMFEQLSTEVE